MHSPPVVVVDQYLVNKYFAGRSAINQQIRRGSTTSTIVGVVGTINSFDLGLPVTKERLYHPIAQVPIRAMALVLKTNLDPQTLVAQVRSAVALTRSPGAAPDRVPNAATKPSASSGGQASQVVPSAVRSSKPSGRVPFPFVVTMILAIGIDLVEVHRIEQAVGRLGRRFLVRIFTPAEVAYCDHRGARFVHYAGRFAAKEAAMKALGTGWGEGVTWREVEILPSPGGAPQVCFHGVALERYTALGAARSHLTISHTARYAVAHVILESDS